MKNVFISHATEDQATAAEVCGLLEARGIACWIAPRDVAPGKVWDEAILDAIESASAFLLILSVRANSSSFVKNEVNRAFSQDKPIFTFRVEDVQPGRSLELYLARHHWTDGFPPPLDKKADHLATAINAVVQGDAAQSTGAASAAATAPRKVSRLAGLRSTIRRLAARERSGWMLVFGLGAGAGAVVAGLLAVSLMRGAPAVQRQPAHFGLVTSAAAPFYFAAVSSPDLAISPDGSLVVYTSGQNGTELMVRTIDQLEAIP